MTLATVGLLVLGVVCILAAFMVGSSHGYARGWVDGIDFVRSLGRARMARGPRDPMT